MVPVEGERSIGRSRQRCIGWGGGAVLYPQCSGVVWFQEEGFCMKLCEVSVPRPLPGPVPSVRDANVR
jgi:hypothetical protein